VEKHYGAAAVCVGAGEPWINPNRATGAPNGLCAEAFSASQRLVVRQYGFMIPDDAVLTQIRSGLWRMADGVAWTTHYELYSGAVVGNNEADPLNPEWEQSMVEEIFDGSRNADPLWGLGAWTPAQFRSAAFGVSLHVAAEVGYYSALVDAVWLELTYTVQDPARTWWGLAAQWWRG